MIAIVIVVIVLAGCAKKESTTKEYKVGLIVSLSGYMGDPGKALLNGFLLKLDQINDAGRINGHTIKTIIYDSETDPAKAVIKTKKLINEDKVVMILGAVGGGRWR